jgi:hypothetical protein
MALIFRSMKVAPDGKPSVENTARGLGVRVGGSLADDLTTDENGNVHPNTGGMSVVESWRELDLHRIPKRLKHFVQEASGSNSDACWRMGSGRFANAHISDELQLRTDSPTHGFVEPAGEMPLAAYLQALASTRDHWTIDED